MSRVTRLGEIFATWVIMYILWAVLLKITEEAQIVFQRKKSGIHFEKNLLGNILGDCSGGVV
jgi:hypothetical protein